MDQAGLLFIRRAFEGGRHYFIANRGEQPLTGWVTLATSTASVAIMDAMTGRAGIGALRQNSDGTAQVYLQLQPGESVILRAFAERKIVLVASTFIAVAFDDDGDGVVLFEVL